MVAFTWNELLIVAVVIIFPVILLNRKDSESLIHLEGDYLSNNIFKFINVHIHSPTVPSLEKHTPVCEDTPTQAKSTFFTMQPKPCIVKSGQRAGFNVSFPFDGASYHIKWQGRCQKDQPWVNLPSPSSTSTSLVFTAHPQQDGWLFRCVVSRYPDGPTYVSDEALLTVFSS